jgi:hypothetical protein
MIFTVLFCTIAGVYSTVYRDTLCVFCAFVYPLFGFFNGYYSSKLYTFFKGTDQRTFMNFQIVVWPLIFFFNLVILDLLELIERENTTFPIGLTPIFLAVNIPIVLFGSFLGRK